MFAPILSHQTMLVRDYPGAPPPPPAPPAPPDPPIPPLPEPIAFSAVTRGSLFGITGAATGTITLATITCADASMTVSASQAVPGLTFTYAANVLTVAGTPTTPTGVHRVVVSYIASGAVKTIRGSTEHVITIVSASEVLTIGSMAGASGRVGNYFGTQTLCTVSSTFDADVTASVSGYIPQQPLGVVIGTASFSWNRAAKSGALSLNAFVPSQAGTYALTVQYRANGQVVGASSHTIEVAAAYQSPAPAPAPAPGPPAPAPVPPPAPTPAPAPGLGPDALLSSVRVLMRFDAIGSAAVVVNEANTFHSFFASPGQTSFTLPALLYGGDYITLSDVVGQGLYDEGAITYPATVSGTTVTITGAFRYEPVACYYRVARALVSQWADSKGSIFAGTNARITTGAVEQGGYFVGGGFLQSQVAGCDGSDGALAVECMADIGATAWDALMSTANTRNRFSPALTLMTTAGALVWTLGFMSKLVAGVRAVYPVFINQFGQVDTVGAAVTPALGGRPGRFVHLCGAMAPSGDNFIAAAWFDGNPSAGATYARSALRTAATGLVRIGGACPALPSLANNAPTDIVAFTGVVDEARVTAANRYASQIGMTPQAIAPAYRVIPWPNY